MSRTLVVVGMLAGCGSRPTLVIDGTTARLNGDLGDRSDRLISAMIEDHPEVTTLEFEVVPGSLNDEANARTGRSVREAGLNTMILDDGWIASGGVDLFCAGVERTAGENVGIGVHSWKESGPGGREATDYPDDDPEHELYRSYFSEMLGEDGPDFYSFTIHAAAAADIHWMTAEEVTQFGLVTTPGGSFIDPEE